MFVDSKVFYILFSWKICQVWLDGYSYFYREFLIFEKWYCKFVDVISFNIRDGRGVFRRSLSNMAKTVNYFCEKLRFRCWT